MPMPMPMWVRTWYLFIYLLYLFNYYGLGIGMIYCFGCVLWPGWTSLAFLCIKVFIFSIASHIYYRVACTALQD